MTAGNLDLDALARRLATRDPKRTEANVQSDLHAFLLSAPLELEEHNLREEIVLEQQAGARRRIDVEAGFCVFEVKRDLRKGNVRNDAIEQLTGYVAARTKTMQQRYVGVLTDGAEWHLHHLEGGALRHVSTFTLDAAKPDVEGLSVWLEGVLATARSVTPTSRAIAQRLGASSPGHALDCTEVKALFDKSREIPAVRLKRELWARLLTTAFGTGFTDSDELFVDHTLLVATAEIIAHAVVGIDPTAQNISAATILSGHLFGSAQIHGVVDADFFDWLVEVPGGERFVKTLARRLSRFAWQDVEHDVLKDLYESVISTAQRKQLGEYYTPDWLANRIVEDAVTDPLNQRVLDPACGSGTFLFHAIRRYMDAAAAKGLDDATALAGVTGKVFGMDIHPVAVTFARVTYLLAIGADRLRAVDRPPIHVPVYLGDSIQWGQERTLFTANALVIPTTGAAELWVKELRFPASVLDDAAKFDRLVDELAGLAAGTRKRGSPVPSIASLQKHYSVPKADQPILAETFSTLCRLHDDGTNHIWGYYVRNLARPFWLARPENRVDVLVGNPPWLSYRFMTAAMQQEFRQLSEERGLWAGAAVATSQDLSGLFVLRAIERYLREDGRFGFVMPWAVLRGRQFAGFRSGFYEPSQQVPLRLRFAEPWDLSAVKPAFFPVPASVIRGERAAKAPIALPESVDRWKGKLPKGNLDWKKAKAHLARTASEVQRAENLPAGEGSPYAEAFDQGAMFVPRMLLVVELAPVGPLGAGAGRVEVRSRRSATEKKPWKYLPTMEGNVDRQFVRAMHVGETVLPYRLLPPRLAIVPWDAKRLMDSSDDRLQLYPGLADWWNRAEETWNKHRRSPTLSLRAQLDFRQKLSKQLPIVPNAIRVVYGKAGLYLAAAVVTDQSVIDHKLYWGTASGLPEARYLEAVLNSSLVTLRTRPLQARGQHNPRDIDKYVWHLPIPQYDEKEELHLRLAALGAQAETIAASIQLPAGKKFELLRRLVRETIAATDTGKQIEEEVALLLG